MRIKIQNFQILGNVSLEVEGLTTLIGTTHSGKSAVMRAVESALYNPRGSESIRVGARYAEIGLSFQWQDKPVTWTWTKQQSSSLDVNGHFYKKIGSAPPEDLLKQVGFQEIKVGDITFRPHFQRQLTDLFGISEKSTTLFNLLLAFSDFNRLPGIRKRIDKDLKDLNVSRLATEQEINSYQERIDQHEAFLRAARDSEKLQRFDKSLDQFTRFYDISMLVGEFEAAEEKDVHMGQTLIGVRNSITALNDLIADTDKLMMIDRFVVDHDEVAVQGVKVDQLALKAANGGSSLKLLLDEIETVSALHHMNCDHRDASEDCANAEEVNHRVYAAVQKLNDAIGSYERIRDTDHEVTLIASHDSTVSELQDRITTNEAKLQIIIDQISDIDECPECGAPIKDGHYHEPARIEATETRAGKAASGPGL